MLLNQFCFSSEFCDSVESSGRRLVYLKKLIKEGLGASTDDEGVSESHGSRPQSQNQFRVHHLIESDCGHSRKTVTFSSDTREFPQEEPKRTSPRLRNPLTISSVNLKRIEQPPARKRPDKDVATERRERNNILPPIPEKKKEKSSRPVGVMKVVVRKVSNAGASQRRLNELNRAYAPIKPIFR